MAFLDIFKKKNSNAELNQSADSIPESTGLIEDTHKSHEETNKGWKRIDFHISCKDTIDKQKLYEFILVLLQYVTPTKIGASQYRSGHSVKYYPKRLPEAFESEMDESNDRITFHLDGDGFLFVIKKERLCKFISIILSFDYDIADKVFPEIERFIVEDSVIASESDSYDEMVQNEPFISQLELLHEDPSDFPKCKGTLEDIEIDIEKNPGYVYKTQGLHLGGFYRMWFGEDSYAFLDKSDLRSFPCFENILLENDVTRITLNEHIEDYRNRENRQKQWEFRKKLHIDDIARRMQEEEKEFYKRNADPEINIQEGNFEHGGVRLIHTYLKNGNIAHRSEADSVEIRELDADGKEVFKDIIVL